MPSPGITSFERRGQRLLSRHRFADRMLKAIGLWCILAVVGLAIGMAGYASLEGMSLADSYVNAAMILSGMGPMGELKTTAGRFSQDPTRSSRVFCSSSQPASYWLRSSTAYCIISTWRAKSRIDANRQDFGVAFPPLPSNACPQRHATCPSVDGRN
jgi:hypothetical protein